MPTAPYPLLPQPLQRGWLEHHPLWKIPLGFLIVILLTGGTGIGAISIAMVSIRHSEVYQQAMSRASQSAEVQSKIGEPLTTAWFISGELHVNGSAGSANLSIPVSGPKGKGTIRVIAFKNAGIWSFSCLQFHVAGAPYSINLLSPLTQ